MLFRSVGQSSGENFEVIKGISEEDVNNKINAKYDAELDALGQTTTEPAVQTVKPENISSKGSEFAKKLTNPYNDVEVTYKGKVYKNSEHAYQTWKSGEFNEAVYNEGNKYKNPGVPELRKYAKPRGNNTFEIMVDILTEKLKQHPELIQGINERGGLAYIEQSTHNVIGDKFWESTGQNKFIEALAQAYKNIQPTTQSTVQPTTKSEIYVEPELPNIDTESNVDKVLRESATPELTDKYLDDNFPPQKLDKLGSYIASYRLKYDSIKDEKGVVTKSAIQNNKLKDLSKSLLSNYSKFKTELTTSSNPRELWRKFLRDNMNDVLLLSGISIDQFEKYYNDTLSLEELNNC